MVAYDDECVGEISSEGETPLHVAVRRNDVESAKILIEGGSDINAAVQGSSVYAGYTPLHFAASQGFLDIAAVLLDRKDIRVSRGSSFGHVGAPLHVACMSGNEIMAELLLSKGADPSELTSFGHSPLAVSASKGYIPQRVRSYYRVSDARFCRAHLLVKLLLTRLQAQSSASLATVVNHADQHGDSCLHLAFQSQCQRVFNYNYPLQQNHVQIAYDLILAGASTRAKNEEGDTPLDLVHPDLANFFECSSRRSSSQGCFVARA